METKQKLCIIKLNERCKIENCEKIEDCTLNDFARDYILATNQNNIEIDETRNGDVYFKYIDTIDDKIYMVELYVLKNTKMKELIENIEEIKTEIKYRNEE